MSIPWWAADALDRDRLKGFVDPVLDRVEHACEVGRFPHALLLVGPAGLGRELAAVEISVMLTCRGGDRPWSDGSCAGRVRSGSHPDVVAVLPQGASQQIKIEQVREIVDGAAARPYEGEHRVWILDGVEASHLVPAAANAFLKVLEEPPDHCRFLLLAANPTAVLPTIRSRCQQLSLPGPAEVASRLGVAAPAGLDRAVLAGSQIWTVRWRRSGAAPGWPSTARSRVCCACRRSFHRTSRGPSWWRRSRSTRWSIGAPRTRRPN